MRTLILAAAVVLLAGGQIPKAVPVGTVLPAMLETGLSNKTKPHDELRARLMQTIPLPAGEKVPEGTRVFGEVLEVTGGGTSGSTIRVRFDRLVTRNGTMTIVTSLRAMASPLEVDEAQIPAMGPDKATPPVDYTTEQVGRDEFVYRGGGHVVGPSGIVGEPVSDGVLGLVLANPSEGCRGQIAGNEQPQAMWIFAADACGAYGFDGVKIKDAGRSRRLGEIELSSPQSSIKVRGGSGLLLRVVSDRPEAGAA
jgi:hypothetical protein